MEKEAISKEEKIALHMFNVGFVLAMAIQERIARKAKARAAARKEEDKVKVKVASRANPKEKADR